MFKLSAVSLAADNWRLIASFAEYYSMLCIKVKRNLGSTRFFLTIFPCLA